jgi:hypothetical protein
LIGKDVYATSVYERDPRNGFLREWRVMQGIWSKNVSYKFSLQNFKISVNVIIQTAVVSAKGESLKI